ncbi:MAG: ATP-dependent sacrificial sulfur transferase LarE [SAR202 cluster bacterium]|nr:ATP-dependent sacrificial sulfur transferase LarE [SAR202 cluster bacterium]
MPTAKQPLDDSSTQKRLSKLEDILRDMASVVVAYSGGVDSALVAVAAHRALGSKALAVTAVSPALAARELEEATSLARRFGFAHRTIHTQEMAREGYVANSPQRCYFCKTELYADLCKLAQAEGYAWVASGTNADDLGDFRPGLQAASEHRVRSPLVEAGLDKAAVRQVARMLDLPIWDKPAQPCLSSRIPYGTPVTIETLLKIERAEDYLRGLGLREVRARHHDKLCRLEVGEAEMELAFARRQEITAHLKKLGYLWVSLDLAGLRSGSLNDGLKVTHLPNQQSQNEIPTMQKKG